MSLDNMEVDEYTSVESFKYSDKSSTLMESKNSDLRPITPFLTEEKVKFNKYDDDPSTPIEDVFDPCGTGTNKMKTHQLNPSVAKKLDFSSNECATETEVENDLLMGTVYESLLEDIIFKQSEDILAEILALDSSRDVVKTPPPVARVAGLVDMCPSAPLKPKQVGSMRTVDDSLCRRKLDFDSCV